jgi:hypothetical protein
MRRNIWSDALAVTLGKLMSKGTARCTMRMHERRDLPDLMPLTV